jgi:cell division protease FtsH
MIRHAMGGRAAEELIFEHLSTGASDDLKKATDLARQMICHYGMSERLGPVSYGDDGQDVFLGRDFVSRKDYSEKKSQEIDEEVEKLLHQLYGEARALLEENREVLDRMATALLERETLEAVDLERIMAGEPLAPLPAPPSQTEPGKTRPRPESPKPFAGDKLPDPEPVPG